MQEFFGVKIRMVYRMHGGGKCQRICLQRILWWGHAYRSSSDNVLMGSEKHEVAEA